MRRRFWTILALCGGVAVLVLIVFVLVRERQGAPPLRDQNVPTTELFLPSAAQQGHWGNPAEGAQWEESRRQIGIELSGRKETGPIRCVLRVKPGAAATHDPELEVKLTNISDDSVSIHVHRFALDNVTFIFRSPDDSVLSSFCYVTTNSLIESSPPVVLKPGESKTSQLFLSVAADHGFQSLRPGLYSLEAVFHEKLFFDLPVPQQGMLARSNRIAVRVGES